MPSAAARHTAPRRRAATYVDAVIMVFVVGILAAVTTPRFVDSLNRQRCLAAAERVRADLEYARSAAIARSRSVTVSFDVASSTCQVSEVQGLRQSSEAYATSLADTPYSASLVSADFDGASQVVFDQFGEPDAAGAIVVQAGTFQTTVSVDDGTGRATLP